MPGYFTKEEREEIGEEFLQFVLKCEERYGARETILFLTEAAKLMHSEYEKMYEIKKEQILSIVKEIQNEQT